MEFVAGSKEDCDLRAEVMRGPLKPETALNYAIHICTALTHARYLDRVIGG
jgi:hypothetical protein